MRIGIFGGDSPNRTVAENVDLAAAAHEQGFDSYWLPQIFGPDALTLLAVIGQQVPGITLGTAVVPTYPRHPLMLASQALTTQSASDGRLVLGIGLSHQIVIENVFGYSFEKPVRHMREYLSILLPLLHGEGADFDGDTLHGHGVVAVGGSSPVPTVIAALGPKMLALAGSLADGTITWMTGPKTLAEHTVPTLQAAAAEAGRPDPRVVASLPVCVTTDVAGARQRAAKVFEVYGVLPSYRAMLDREGASGPADVAIVGTADEVRAGIAEVTDAGATDFAAVEFGGTEAERADTRDLLRSLL